MITRVLTLLALLSGLAHGEPPPAPRQPDAFWFAAPGSLCPGLLPCTDVARFSLQLRLDIHWLPPTEHRNHAASLQAAVQVAMGELAEIALRAGFLGWQDLSQPEARGHEVWNLLQLSGRVALPFWQGRTDRPQFLVGYDHQWGPSGGQGLLRAGATLGHGYGVVSWSPLSWLTLGANAGAIFDPERPHAAVETGAQLVFRLRDEDRLALFVQGMLRTYLGTPQELASGFAACGAAGVNWIDLAGVQMGFAFQVCRGDLVPPLGFLIRLGESVGVPYERLSLSNADQVEDPEELLGPELAQLHQVVVDAALAETVQQLGALAPPLPALAQWAVRSRVQGIPRPPIRSPGWTRRGTPRPVQVRPPPPPRPPEAVHQQPTLRPQGPVEPSRPPPTCGPPPDPVRSLQQEATSTPRGRGGPAPAPPPAAAAPPPSAASVSTTTPAPGRYDHVPDPKRTGAGLPTSRGQRRAILEENRGQNDGKLRSDESGEPLVPPQASRKGTVHLPNEAHVDHFHPRSKGGSNSNTNLRVVSREENLKKGNKVP